MEKSKLKKGQEIYFIEEKAPMIIKAINENYAICTRNLHRWYDADLIKYEAKENFSSFTDTYKKLRKEIIYSCLDFREGKKAPHNMIFNSFDFKKQKDIDYLLSALEIGEVELSRRNSCELEIDFERTFAK